jgi:heptosyltransferase-2
MPKEQIVLLGGRNDSAGIDIKKYGGRVTDLTGNTSLTEAASVISAARVVIANDSGLMHLAAYSGTPVVGIFGSTNPEWTRPLGARSEYVYTREKCSPCFKRSCQHGHYNCLRGITPEQLSEAVDNVLKISDQK